ncbi:MAG: hypothetical protein WCN86_02515 [bacterium]
MRITRETKIGPELTKRFWDLYDVAFEPLRTASPCRQFMRKHEFVAEMSDELMLKFVLWDDDDSAVAMALVATDLNIVDWISPDYFRVKFPEHYEGGRIYYFGALLVNPGSQGLHFSSLLLEELGNFVARNNGIAAYDCCSFNNEWMPAMIAKSGRMQMVLDVTELDRQFYYSFETKGFLPGHGPSEHA